MCLETVVRYVVSHGGERGCRMPAPFLFLFLFCTASYVFAVSDTAVVVVVGFV